MIFSNQKIIEGLYSYANIKPYFKAILVIKALLIALKLLILYLIRRLEQKSRMFVSRKEMSVHTAFGRSTTILSTPIKEDYMLQFV